MGFKEVFDFFVDTMEKEGAAKEREASAYKCPECEQSAGFFTYDCPCGRYRVTGCLRCSSASQIGDVLGEHGKACPEAVKAFVKARKAFRNASEVVDPSV